MPKSKDIDLTKLSALVTKMRNGRPLRTIAEEIGGVSAPTLSRIQNGHLPDLETFMRICKWLNVSTEDFQIAPLKKVVDSGIDTRETICAYLRADRTLPAATASALTTMIELAYKDILNKTFDDH